MPEDSHQEWKLLRESVAYGPMTQAVRRAVPLVQILSGLAPHQVSPAALFWAGVAPYGAPVMPLMGHFETYLEYCGTADAYDWALRSVARIYIRKEIGAGLEGLMHAARVAKAPDMRLAVLTALACAGRNFGQIDALEFAVNEGLRHARMMNGSALPLLLAQADLFETRAQSQQAAVILSNDLEREIGDEDPVGRLRLERALGRAELCRALREPISGPSLNSLSRAGAHLERAGRLYWSLRIPPWADASSRRSAVDRAYVAWKRSGDLKAITELSPCAEPWTLLVADSFLLELLLRAKTGLDQPGATRRKCHIALKALEPATGDDRWNSAAAPWRSMFVALHGLVAAREGDPAGALPDCKAALENVGSSSLARMRVCSLYQSTLESGLVLADAAPVVAEIGDVAREGLKSRPAAAWPAAEDDDLWH